MCIKLRQTGKIIVPGQTAIIKTKRGDKASMWGFDNGMGIQANARIESLKEKWLKKGYAIGTFEIESFYEANHKERQEKEFKFSGEVGIIYKGEHFLVVTEEAGSQVKKIHHRQPCIRQLKLLLAA